VFYRVYFVVIVVVDLRIVVVVVVIKVDVCGGRNVRVSG